jgi:outer membrane receptor protein involved in Fe transport
VNLRWRHLPPVSVAARAQEDAVIANNARVAAGGGGTLLSYTPISNLESASYDVFDLSGYWTINDTLSLRLGVDNVFNRAPPRISATAGQTTGRPYDPSLTAAQNAANMAALCTGKPGCVAPTTYSVGNDGTGTTSGGYYDVLGRRYFVGLKARF